MSASPVELDQFDHHTNATPSPLPSCLPSPIPLPMPSPSALTGDETPLIEAQAGDSETRISSTTSPISLALDDETTLVDNAELQA